MLTNHEYRSNKQTVRSDHYQFKMCELPFSLDILKTFPNECGIGALLNPFGSSNEAILELQESLRTEFWRLVDERMTVNQRTCLRLTAQGLTQAEIAKVIGCGQTSVTKSINGNVSYQRRDRKGKPKIEGGAIKKLRKLISRDVKIQAILSQMSDIYENQL